MQPEVEVKETIARPPLDVYEALVDAEELVAYFVRQTSGSLVAGQDVIWQWSEQDQQRVSVLEVVPQQRIELSWTVAEVGYPTRVSFELSPVEDGTRLSIREADWKDQADSVGFALTHCAAWERMLLCLKAYLEHGIRLI